MFKKKKRKGPSLTSRGWLMWVCVWACSWWPSCSLCRPNPIPTWCKLVPLLDLVSTLYSWAVSSFWRMCFCSLCLSLAEDRPESWPRLVPIALFVSQPPKLNLLKEACLHLMLGGCTKSWFMPYIFPFSTTHLHCGAFLTYKRRTSNYRYCDVMLANVYISGLTFHLWSRWTKEDQMSSVLLSAL